MTQYRLFLSDLINKNVTVPVVARYIREFEGSEVYDELKFKIENFFGKPDSFYGSEEGYFSYRFGDLNFVINTRKFRYKRAIRNIGVIEGVGVLMSKSAKYFLPCNITSDDDLATISEKLGSNNYEEIDVKSEIIKSRWGIHSILSTIIGDNFDYEWLTSLDKLEDSIICVWQEEGVLIQFQKERYNYEGEELEITGSSSFILLFPPTEKIDPSDYDQDLNSKLNKQGLNEMSQDDPDWRWNID